MKYALISNSIVVNIIILISYNAHEFPNAVKIMDMPVQIGDMYNAEENRFYHNGEPIYNTQEQLSDAQNALGLLGYTDEEAANG